MSDKRFKEGFLLALQSAQRWADIAESLDEYKMMIAGGIASAEEILRREGDGLNDND